MTEPAQPPQESLPIKIVVNLLVVAIMLIPVVMLGSGGWLLWQRQTGDKVRAEVIGCDTDIGYKRATQHCTARWSEDGVERTGPIEASGDQEVGETITATERDGVLYSRSLALPLILIGLGLPFCWVPFAFVRGKLRSRRGAAAGAAA